MFVALMLVAGFTSCDEHEEIDTNIHVGHILCSDGRVLSESDFFAQDQTDAVGVIFTERLSDGRFLAVLLRDVKSMQFCDSLGMKLNTSCSLTEYDGYRNTVNMQNARDYKTNHGSPLADVAYYSHRYGQSDFIPSVAEYRLLFSSRNRVNSVIQAINDSGRGKGKLISTTDDGGCWLWSSTEVEGNPGFQAWLFSMSSGSIQETPKMDYHDSRLIVSYYPMNENINY